ncbi:MAG TPA: LysR family transcriptional regulator, partial [Candidatus Blautia ornithocaccae]|nr:LysR family transcriptional regulator [Candidatus Blautia ornithocaccae]
QLNGYNFLLGSQLGFWDDMCREKMPASRFLVQTDSFTLQELIRESSLPCFATNLTIDDEGTFEGRKAIPIKDQEAKRIFHLVFSPENKKYAVRSGWKSSD